MRTTPPSRPPKPPTATEHLDVLIVGGGLSGVGAGCHLERDCPDRSYAILEARDAIGGTWDLFRYPGIRSDSDMHTLGYSFRPWEGTKTIAGGASILSYIRETALQFGVTDKIRLNQRAVSAAWSTQDARWTVTVRRSDTGDTVTLTASFLILCSGYYRYDEGFTPEFPGVERFKGQLIHPQHWPEDLDYTGKRVVVIGSGATAITLVPAMAPTAAHVTMLQRSPSYVVSLPAEDPLATRLRRVLPSMAAYRAVRWINVALMTLSYQFSRRFPRLARAAIRKGVKRQLPEDFDVDTHFKPRYAPWDQRMCVCPNGDLFRALRHDRASIVTDRIETFTETGCKLESGAELEADVIVTATGLQLLALGGLSISVDGRQLELSEQMTYKGLMLSGVPNLALAIGYTHASWTLKCDISFDYVCRLLDHMRERGYAYCVPELTDESITPQPLLDLASGYIQRSVDQFPRQGSRKPWRLYQNYVLDSVTLKLGDLDDGVMRFARPGSASTPKPEPEPEPEPAAAPVPSSSVAA
jgi:cation diffusion facilitator CzcD-associated flavoprotein CzcO